MKKIFIIPLLFLNFLLPDLLSADQSSVFSVGEDIPIDTRDEMGRTALMRAVWMDNSEAVSRLLSSGADPNLKDINGQTPLYFALQFSENESLLSLLLNSGAEVDTVDNRGRSPYEILINRGIYPHFMSQLLQYGDLPKESSQGESLFFAALDHRFDLQRKVYLESLYSGGSSLDALNRMGRNPEEEALFRDDFEIAAFLADLRVRLNESFIETLDIKGQNISESEVQDFLERGASPGYRNASGYNPCHYAVAAGRPDLLQLFLRWDKSLSPFDEDSREIQNLILFFPLDYNTNTALSLMTLLLDQGLPMNIRDENGHTLLSRSILHSAEIASLLISRGADPNQLDPAGVSPMMTALTVDLSDDSTVLEELAAAGADLKYKDNQGWDILTYGLLYQQNAVIIEKLIALGVNPDVRDDYGTPGFFWAAAYAEDPRLVRLLLTGKSRVLWRDKDGWTPLMGALHFGNSPEIVSFLVQNSPDGRIRDGAGRNLDVFKSIYEETTPYKAPEALNTLIRQKRVYPVDGIPYDSDLNKALNEVVRWGIDAGMVETLIKAGADPDYIDEEGFTALMAAAAFGSHAMVDALIRNGVSVFDVTNYGWTALHLAAWSSDSQSAALLIREGWDVNVRDFENWTPLMWALRNHASPDYIRILLDAGADPSAQTYRKESGLHLACSGWVPPELESLEMLINAGVDVNSVNNKGETPLLHAAAMGYTEVCQYLLEKGGDPGWIDNDGDSAASRAYRNGHYDLAELLELHL